MSAKKQSVPSERDSLDTPSRRKPVPIPGRVSNAELQAEIDGTLDMRIVGGKKLRDLLRQLPSK